MAEWEPPHTGGHERSGAPRITVIGSCTVDRVDHGPGSPGGCPAFVADGLGGHGAGARVITRMARAERALFAPLVGAAGVAWHILEVPVTPAFSMSYAGDTRTMRIDALCAPWSISDLAGVGIDTEWVHLGALWSGEFPVAVVEWLVSAGHRVSLDGQGLVRRGAVGPLTWGQPETRAWPGLSVLKLAEEEAGALVGSAHTDAEMAALGVPEILLTRGSAGCSLYLEGDHQCLAPSRAVRGVQATGAGDAFTVAYVGARADGVPPPEAVGVGSERVVAMLERRSVEGRRGPVLR